MRYEIGQHEEDSGMDCVVVAVTKTHNDGFIMEEVDMTSDGGDFAGKQCECDNNEFDNEFYWACYVCNVGKHEEIVKRYHGWGCGKCRGITQWG